jgi:hypothetical protein
MSPARRPITSVILHAREAYEDEPGSRRHRLRLWLAAYDFLAVEGARRDGIPVRDTPTSAESGHAQA